MEDATPPAEPEKKLVWPPTKEDLERLYVTEHLSAAKIAEAYGLNEKYASPKTAESTILYHLKRNGITRRDKADHARKVTMEMEEDWIGRYAKGESLKQIAKAMKAIGVQVDHVTVFNHLRDRGIKLRDKVEAQIKAATKHQKTPFSRDAKEEAYLVGIALGDFQVIRHGRAVRVRTSTTHPAMADLFDRLFGRYGFVHRYPRETKLTGFEWSLEVDLGSTFEFLLNISLGTISAMIEEGLFLEFLSGFFDAEGTIYLHKKKDSFAPELSIANTSREILQVIQKCLSELGITSQMGQSDQPPDRFGTGSPGMIWRLGVWRFKEMQELLWNLPLRHGEKVSKKDLVLKIKPPLYSDETLKIVNGWKVLLASIKQGRGDFLNEAKKMIEGKPRETTGVGADSV